MPVLELALIHILAPFTPTSHPLSPALLAILRDHHDVQSRASKHPVVYLRQVEDPNELYIIGLWDSPEAHMEHVAGKENQDILESLKGHVDLAKNLVFHVGVDEKEDVWAKLPLDANAISINRQHVTPGKKEEFQKSFDEVKHLLGEYTRPKDFWGGWRIEKEAPEKDEWVLFSGFDSVEHHWGFARTGAFEGYRVIAKCCDGFTLRHARRFEP